MAIGCILSTDEAMNRKDHSRDWFSRTMGENMQDRHRWIPDPKERSDPGYVHHIFVCTNQRPDGAKRPCCSSRGSQDLLIRMKKHARSIGLDGRVQSSGCLDFCEQGPSIAHYPSGEWFGPIRTTEEGCALLDAIHSGEHTSEFSMKLG